MRYIMLLLLISSMMITASAPPLVGAAPCPPHHSGHWEGVWTSTAFPPAGGGWQADVTVSLAGTLSGAITVTDSIVPPGSRVNGHVSCAQIQFGIIGDEAGTRLVSFEGTIDESGLSMSGTYTAISGDHGTWSGRIDPENALAVRFSPVLWMASDDYQPEEVQIMLDEPSRPNCSTELREHRKPKRGTLLADCPTADVLAAKADEPNSYIDIKGIRVGEEDRYRQQYVDLSSTYDVVTYTDITVRNSRVLIDYWLFYCCASLRR